ncbi:MAG: hypothetical protein JWO56_1991 [Acidobacteria bacterium]|nr:hypothetical protein [Acidobacteriota bacterium]
MGKRLPADRAARLATVGAELYGKSWRRRLAAGLGISRSTLHSWIRDASRTARDIDGELIRLLDAEREACTTRWLRLGAMRKRLAGTA